MKTTILLFVGVFSLFSFYSHAQPPDISVTPSSVSVRVPANNSNQLADLEIMNSGGLDLIWAGNSDCKLHYENDYALTFNGMNQYADLVYSFGDLTEFTFEFWRRSEGNGTGGWPRMLSVWKSAPNSGGDDGLLFEHIGENQNEISIWFSPNGMNSQVASFPVAQNEWQHIAFSFNGTSARTYLNGALVNTYTFPPGMVITFNQLQFGGDAPMGRFFNGSLDEIRFWSVTRTETEIQEKMNIRLDGTEAGLIACFRLDEGTGSVVNELTGSTPPANLVNSPLWITPGAMALPFMDIIPDQGVIPAGSFTTVELNFHSLELPYGSYYCNLTINSNDPDDPDTLISVEMKIVDPTSIPVSNWAVVLGITLMMLFTIFFLRKMRF